MLRFSNYSIYSLGLQFGILYFASLLLLIVNLQTRVVFRFEISCILERKSICICNIKIALL